VPTGFEAIREQLAERRSAGQAFELAWPEVVQGASEPSDRRVLAETREAWQEAYEVSSKRRAT
jgi:hypothetical protein